MKKESITIMIPAYNEEENLLKTVSSVSQILRDLFEKYEILLFDDCSTDDTAKIANQISKKNKRIKVIHNKRNMGLGYNYRKGVELAQYKYFSWVPADNEAKLDSVKYLLENAGKADIVVNYTVNKEVRSHLRRIISYGFTQSLNLLFGLDLRYYNGLAVYKSEILKNINVKTNSFAFQAEILIRLIKKGYSYLEVPMYIRKSGNTKIFRIRNFLGVIKTVFRLFLDINVSRKY
jgi:glycosyltransferase involved in cell wall biosynthesis